MGAREKRCKRVAWSEKENAILRVNYPHIPTADIAAMLPGRTLSTIYQHARLIGLKKTETYLSSPAAHRLDGIKGMGTRFQKGHATWNKGTHWTAGGRSAETRFKKGSRSKRWDPEDYCIGALRISTDGELQIKFREGMRAWIRFARFVWESERGPIPKGVVIRTLNGDEDDCRIENLRLTTRQELMRENTYHQYPKEIAQLIQLRGALQRQINKREKEREQHDSRLA